MSKRTALLSVAAAAVMLVALAVPASASPPVPGRISAPCTTRGPVANHRGVLTAVSATSAANVWAVGWTSTTSEPFKTLTLHWDGTRWQPVPSPSPGRACGSWLGGVSAVSATDAWAAGNYYTHVGGPSKSLLLHWNGTRWIQIPVPGDGLSAVSAVSASDVWAVGNVILHWNGSRWQEITPDPVKPMQVLSSVSADSSSDAWAIGVGDNTGQPLDLVMHWNGSHWQDVNIPKPNPSATHLTEVSAVSPSDVWVAGTTPGPRTNPNASALLLHWNGTAWQRVASPIPSGAQTDSLIAVDALSPSDAWAVGNYTTSPTTGLTLMLHWNGTKWAQVAAPTPTEGSLVALSAVSPSDAWAAGASNPGGSVATVRTWVEHWNGQRWTRA